ncbi:sigma-70 family RNA polymerase sigma factor [Maritimibacter sp. UBA3975]|uniref:sigma-70 family RNA polymerase sigma factor n=1 Tax=Maritimibacter sp. UBA3975 TaxID=1946833 RepID=UPI000C0B8606|nr:sigma-70 family RNA polymerase sigma factor [Maritimibacter sp. UBA3975]MAM61643.1 RNA polymerase subunit sigma [Maritimibacter sp.]|tara:strand:- start:11069 stop:11608 length:540 start_codon:yes stop_codon:yes gene_type:complete
MATRDEIDNWIARCALGDRSAFKNLYDHTSAKLFGVTLRVLKDRGEAEDALQEAYVKIWKGSKRYASGGASPMTWLITIARNHAIDRLRVRKTTEGDDKIAEMPDAAPGPEARAVAASEAKRVEECFSTLEPDRATAVRRAYLEGDSYADLARHFDVPLNTMRTWLRRSLIKLRECLEP